MHQDKRLPSHERNLLWLKPKKTAFHIIFGEAAA
jgi:hypothetical protein